MSMSKMKLTDVLRHAARQSLEERASGSDLEDGVPLLYAKVFEISFALRALAARQGQVLSLDSQEAKALLAEYETDSALFASIEDAYTKLFDENPCKMDQFGGLIGYKAPQPQPNF